MTEYRDDPNEIVFLNNKNIAQKQSDIEGDVKYHAIPSLSLFNATYTELTNDILSVEVSAYGISCKVNDLCTEISGRINQLCSEISGRVNQLCSEISNAISGGDFASKEYVEQLSGEVETISASLRGTVTVIDKSGNVVGNDLSVRTLTNAEYIVLDESTQLAPNEIYLIDDSYESVYGKIIKHVGNPLEDSDAATKYYVDEHLSAFVKYNDFDFRYYPNQHYIVFAATTPSGIVKQLSVDTTEFIKNKIIDHIDIHDDTLYLYWKNAEGISQFTSIPLDKLVTIYKSGGGISIARESDGYTISCTSDIVRQSDLTSITSNVGTLQTNYQELSARIVNSLEGITATSTTAEIGQALADLKTAIEAI